MRKLLKNWEVAPEIPANFNAEVWRKVSLHSERSEAGFWSFLLALTRPAVAAVFMGLSVTSGILFAHHAVDNRKETAKEQLQTQYFASIDPLRHRANLN